MISFKGSFSYQDLFNMSFEELKKWNETAQEIYKDSQ